MELIIGGLFQGKTDYINSKYNLVLKKSVYFSKFVNEEYIVLLNCHMYEGDIKTYIESLDNRKTLIVSTSVVGNAIVPIHRSEREFRDNVGINNKYLAEHSKMVVRIWNGLAETVKC